jgi:hypothetical protein
MLTHVHMQITYEQDWLDYEIVNMYYMLESATAGSEWLKQVQHRT